MKKLVYILVTVLLVLTACTGTSRHPQLVAADSLLLTRPDSDGVRGRWGIYKHNHVYNDKRIVK